jgi:hypothetical protein
LKLDPQLLSYIQNVVNTAEALKIDMAIFEQDMVRGADDNVTIFICHTENVPDIPFTALNIFSSRVNLVKNIDKFEVDVVVQPATEKTPEFARALVMKGSGAKVDYRCGNPNLMKSPKEIKQPFIYKTRMTPEAMAMIQKGQAAFGSDEVAFIGTDDGVILEIVDSNGDKLNYKFADIHVLDDENDGDPVDFNHKYPIKHLQAMFKNDADKDFYLSARGILRTTVNGLTVYILHKEE